MIKYSEVEMILAAESMVDRAKRISLRINPTDSKCGKRAPAVTHDDSDYKVGIVYHAGAYMLTNSPSEIGTYSAVHAAQYLVELWKDEYITWRERAGDNVWTHPVQEGI